jgi:hypothetical protein
LDNARNSYRAVKKDPFAGATRWLEISMVVLQAPLRATSANNVAAFAASRALQKTYMKNAAHLSDHLIGTHEH